MSRTVVVTGAASGIGRATADLLVERGDRVIGVDLRDADVCSDLSSPDGRAEAVAGVIALSPTVDAVVACAGISGNSPAVIAINFFGVTEFVTGLLPALGGSSAPRVAVVASSVAVHASDAALGEACLAGEEESALKRAVELDAEGRGSAIYPGSKAALARWVRRESVTSDWAGAGIALNAVAPGIVRTPMSAQIFEDPRMIAAADQALPMPLNGHQDPEVLASALAFLVAEENTHITGQVIFCDGGGEAVNRGADVF
ncbi:SDR family oxidoreductase [Nocardioides sp. JQ2195]|uniref:SDR family oxidoreductase n=1 Tax=Nocardioides sp. JQ2195 TaxID=2592334 RepID=UPI00143EAA9B|nr:SDR family oxidoreductase [Nocardioides sp. JQ2195]QIX25622.1 SDR family oxidoreductase [Nocardioides sp. JQ2195]